MPPPVLQFYDGRHTKSLNLHRQHLPRLRSYALHLRYMAVHVFKEFDRKKKDELLNMAQSCRRICTHRTSLQRLAVTK